jgi:hypothetical protein
MELYRGGPVLALYGADLAQPLGVTAGLGARDTAPKTRYRVPKYHDIGVEFQALRCSNLIPGVKLIPAIAKGTSTGTSKGGPDDDPYHQY